MSLEMEFTDEEIREELARLGYENVPSDKLAEFKRDLMKLIYTERSKSTSFNSSATEQKEEDSGSDESAVIRERTDFPQRDFTNHSGQLFQEKGTSSFHEDWHYRGKDKLAQGLRAKSAQERSRVPGSYSLYELPMSSQLVEKDDHNNCFGEETSEGEYPTEYTESEMSIKRKVFRRRPTSRRPLNAAITENDTAIMPPSKTAGSKRKAARSRREKRRAAHLRAQDEIEAAEGGPAYAAGAFRAGIFEIYEKIKDMALRDCECGKTKPRSRDMEPRYRLNSKVSKTPSVILQRTENPHTRNLVRCKPGDRLKMYEKMWKKQPPIGDDFRKDLRKEMHAKLSQKEEIHHDHKVYIPNTYVVPSDKLRLGLRWQVRHALENYKLPPQGVFHD